MTLCRDYIEFLVTVIYKCAKHYNYFQAQFRPNTFTNIKVIKNTCTHTYTDKNAKLIKAWVQLKLFIVLGLMKSRCIFH
jgi:hypothetical protein